MNIMTYVLLIIGFGLLIKGADIFVDGSSSVAKRFGISDLVIGLTIVAFGTSAPELAVSTLASLEGANEIAFSNIVGSNLFNLLFVVGVCSVMRPMKVQSSLLRKEIPFSIVAAIVLLLLAVDTFAFTNVSSLPSIDVISQNDGLILLVFFAIFLYSTLVSSKENKESMDENSINEEGKTRALPISLCFIIFGLAAIIFGGNLIVDSAVVIATSFGLSQTLIGLTIVSIGTSLPEFITSVIATKKGNADIALGNVVGSNIFNIFAILGISATISPVGVTGDSVIDTVILAILSIIILFMAFTKKCISRVEGAIMVVMYIVYMGYIIIR